MVAPAVRTLGRLPVRCHARPLLFKAHASLECGGFIAAGCQLREAMRLFLLAECEYCDCVPAKKSDRSPKGLAKSLRKAGELRPDLYSLIVEIIDIGNQAMLLQFVRPETLTTCIMLMHSFLDGSPYLVQPVAAGRLS